jgi:hypothetical protein
MIEVRCYNDSDGPAYDQCIVSAPQNLIYPTRPFLAFLKEVTGGEVHSLVAEENGQILGVFPSLLKRDLHYGTVCNSLPWYGSYGGCTLADKACPQVRESLIRAWLAMIHEYSDLLTATVVLSPFEEMHLDSYAAILVNGAADSRVGQMSSLPADGADLDENLIKLFRQKTRNLVRKSLKQKFSLVSSDEEWAWNFLCVTHHENMTAVGGVPKPKGHFDALRRHIPAEWRDLLVATIDGKPVAALLMILFNKTVEYITPVIEKDYRSLQPLSFLIWHGMMRAAKNGFRWWNWGGTWHTQKSLHHFKAGWGAVDMPYSYLICASESGRKRLAEHRSALRELFPYYYTYPYHLL